MSKAIIWNTLSKQQKEETLRRHVDGETVLIAGDQFRDPADDVRPEQPEISDYAPFSLSIGKRGQLILETEYSGPRKGASTFERERIIVTNAIFEEAF